MDSIKALRSIRSQNRVPPSAKATVVIQPSNDEAADTLRWGEAFIRELGRAGGLTIDATPARPAQSGASVTDSSTVFVALAGLVDIDAERHRLKKNIDKFDKKHNQLVRKLDNPNFLENAPLNIIEDQEAKKQELAVKIQGLRDHLDSISGG